MCSLVLPSEWEANSLKNASHNQFFARLIKTTALSETKLSYYCVVCLHGSAGWGPYRVRMNAELVNTINCCTFNFQIVNSYNRVRSCISNPLL